MMDMIYMALKIIIIILMIKMLIIVKMKLKKFDYYISIYYKTINFENKLF